VHVNHLDHVNIVTHDVAGTARFYADLLGLEVRDGPPPSRPEVVQWVYDGAGRPIVHVNAVGSFSPIKREVASVPGPNTGAVHHVAFNCAGHDEMVERLNARQLEFGRNAVDAIGLKQLFVLDPNGVMLELNFYEA
jgi:catechol 2,3-dioxygenase-like lactoylglutathione lyase family enzyme